MDGVIGSRPLVNQMRLDMLLKLNDKLLHFLACLVITLTAGELCAVTAGVTKEAADWMYKKNCKVGSGWDWLDILAMLPA